MKRFGIGMAIAATLLLWPLAAFCDTPKIVEPKEPKIVASEGDSIIVDVEVAKGKKLVRAVTGDAKVRFVPGDDGQVYLDILKGSNGKTITVSWWYAGEAVKLPEKAPLPTLPIATLTIVVGDQPPPEPGPTPPPGPGPQPVPTGKLTLIGVTDNDARTVEQAAILMDVALANKLTESGINWRLIDDSSEAFRNYKLDNVLADAKLTSPAMVLYADGKLVRTAAAPKSSSEVLAFVGLKKALAKSSDEDAAAPYVDAGGDRRFLTRVPPKSKFFAAPRWSDAKALVPRDQWKEISRRSVFPPGEKWTFDQDGKGSCVGQASTMGMMRSRTLSGKSYYKLSPTCTYAQINGGSDNGAIIGDSLAALKKNGTILFDRFPQDRIYLSQLPSNWRDEAKRFRIEDAYVTPSFDEIASAIQQGFVCVIGVHVGNNFTPNSQGVAGVAYGPGNHAVLADGMRLINGKWYLDVQNSWGVSWGDDGRYYQGEAHFRNGLQADDFYAIRGAVEDPMDPALPQANQVIPSTLLPRIDGPISNPVQAAGYWQEVQECVVNPLTGRRSCVTRRVYVNQP